VLTNLTLNHEHSFLLNASTNKGERNSSLYSWFIGEHLLMKKNGILAQFLSFSHPLSLILWQ